MSSFEYFMDCVCDVVVAKADLKAAYDACDHSPSYFCDREQQELDRCNARAKAAFVDAIREATGAPA